MQDKAGYHHMRRLVGGFATSIAISTVTELGIPDLLADGPRSVADIARRVGADEGFLRRVRCSSAAAPAGRPGASC